MFVYFRHIRSLLVLLYDLCLTYAGLTNTVPVVLRLAFMLKDIRCLLSQVKGLLVGETGEGLLGLNQGLFFEQEILRNRESLLRYCDLRWYKFWLSPVQFFPRICVRLLTDLLLRKRLIRRKEQVVFSVLLVLHNWCLFNLDFLIVFLWQIRLVTTWQSHVVLREVIFF